MSDEAFIEWGWRLPFIASIVLIGISLYVQLRMEDTEAFKALKASQADAGEQAVVPKSPVLEAIRRYPRRIMLAAGAFLSVQVTFYILIAFVIAYGLNSPSVELTRDEMLTSVLIAAAAMIPALFYFSGMSDRVGRKQIYRWGAILTGVWGFALFPLIDTGSPLMITLAVTVGMIFLGMQYGPQAAYFTELFSTEVRYSGASLGYQIGAILGGALAPTIAVLLWNELGIFYVSVYIPGSSGPHAVVTVSAGGDGREITVADQAGSNPASRSRGISIAGQRSTTNCRPASKPVRSASLCTTPNCVHIAGIPAATTSCVTSGSDAASRKISAMSTLVGRSAREAYTCCPSSLCPAKPGLMGRTS